MSTDYGIFVKAPDVPGSTDLQPMLIAAGATNFASSQGSPDSYQFDYPGLEDCEVINERLNTESAWEEEPEFGYDFQVVAWVRFAVDNQETRDAVFRLTEQVARHFPTLLMYQEMVLARADEPGALTFVDPLPEFIVDGIRRDGLPEGMTPEQIGME